MKTLIIALLCATCLFACKKESNRAPAFQNLTLVVTPKNNQITWGATLVNKRTGDKLINLNNGTLTRTFSFSANSGDKLDFSYYFSAGGIQSGLEGNMVLGTQSQTLNTTDGINGNEIYIIVP